MDIKTLGDLGKLADLCRKKGIESIKVTSEAVEFKLTEKPQARRKKGDSPSNETDILSPLAQAQAEEAAMFWSSQGHIVEGAEG